MLKEFFTRNLPIKLLALLLSIILWAIARFWSIQ